MRFIQPSVEYWQQEAGMEGVWKQIARACRVSYQSKQKKGESDLDFVKRVIFKPALIEGDLNDLEHCKFDFNKMHGSVLEHGTVYLKADEGTLRRFVLGSYDRNPYSKYLSFEGMAYVTTNMRVIVECNKWKDLCYLWPPTEYHAKRYTFNVITDIGVTREINRTRKFSIIEESTRYCDYTKGKFGEELTFIRPAWWQQDDSMNPMLASFQEAEQMYQRLRKQGWKPEQARQVLPLGLKTQAVYSAYQQDWLHFLQLRSSKAISGKPHPNMVYIADKIDKIGKENNLW